MKKTGIIFFLVVFLVSATELNQLLKLPVLIEHFNEHKALNNQVSFFDFMYMHYTGHDINDNDYDRDMQLPFKSHNDYNSVQVQIIPVQSETVTLNLPAVIIKNFTKYKNQVIHFSFSDPIWQPPKTC